MNDGVVSVGGRTVVAGRERDYEAVLLSPLSLYFDLDGQTDLCEGTAMSDVWMSGVKLNAIKFRRVALFVQSLDVDPMALESRVRGAAGPARCLAVSGPV